MVTNETFINPLLSLQNTMKHLTNYIIAPVLALTAACAAPTQTVQYNKPTPAEIIAGMKKDVALSNIYRTHDGSVAVMHKPSESGERVIARAQGWDRRLDHTGMREWVRCQDKSGETIAMMTIYHPGKWEYDGRDVTIDIDQFAEKRPETPIDGSQPIIPFERTNPQGGLETHLSDKHQ